jgi:hypothetical protein
MSPTDDIDLTGEHSEEAGLRGLKAETEELRGCWRIFFLIVGLFVVVLIGVLAYQYAFVWQPWKSATERAAEQQADVLASLPPIPDVIGASLVDGLFELREAGYPQILLFTSELHGFAPTSDLAFNPGLPITLTNPAPGEPPSLTVDVWVGDRPVRPENIPVDSFWFEHTETTNERGTYQCLSCHTPEFCTTCHEDRLRSAANAFLADPKNAPELAKAISSATGIELDHVHAVYQGIGWYRVDFLIDDPGEANEEAQAAREAAVAAFPAAFNAEPEAEIVLLRWVYSGTLDPMVEIGLERETYGRQTWMSVEPSDIPWVVDRYVVTSGAEQ